MTSLEEHTTSTEFDQGFPLTPVQRSLYTKDLINEADDLCDGSTRIVWWAKLRDGVDLDTLRRAIERAVSVHPMLRAAVEPSVQRTPTFSIQDCSPIELDLVSAPTALSKEALVRDNLQLDLRGGVPARFVVVDDEAGDRELLVVIHHVVFDGESARRFFSDVSRYYAEPIDATLLDNGHRVDAHFAEHALATQKRIASGGFDPGLAFWRTELSGAPLVLPYMDANPHVLGSIANVLHVECRLSPELSADLQSFARQQRITLFMLLSATFNLVLHRLTGAVDLLIGTPMSTRSYPRVAETVGCFLNTVVLRSRLDESMTVDSWLALSRRSCSNAMEHRMVPFELILDDQKVARNSGHSPLVQALFQLDHPVFSDGGNGPLVSLREQYVGASLPLTAVAALELDGRIGIEIRSTLTSESPLSPVGVAALWEELLQVLCAVDPGTLVTNLAAAPEVTAPEAESELGRIVGREFCRCLRIEAHESNGRFFDLGGDSLAALELAQGLTESTGQKVRVLHIFNGETINGIIEEIKHASEATKDRGVLPQ